MWRCVLQVQRDLGWRNDVVNDGGGGRGAFEKMRGKVKGKFERIEVDERWDERPSDMVGDAEEEQGGLYRVRFPSEMKAPDVLRQMRTRRERLAAAQRGDGHGRHHSRRSRRSRRLKVFRFLISAVDDGSGEGG